MPEYYYEKVKPAKKQRHLTEGPSEANRLFQPSSRFRRNHAGWDSLDTVLALARFGLGRLLPGGGIPPPAPLSDAAGDNVDSVSRLRSDSAMSYFLYYQGNSVKEIYYIPLRSWGLSRDQRRFVLADS